MLKFLAAAAAVLFFALAGPNAPAFAQSDLQTLSLDQLFARLHDAPSEAAARDITDNIWRKWTQPKDPELAQRMAEAIADLGSMNLSTALDEFTAITQDYPEYAEGWNQRATLRYMLGDYPGSLADIDETLKREPRHFGALAGRALIYLKLGDKAQALQSVTEALKYNPFLSERRLFPELPEPPTHI